MTDRRSPLFWLVLIFCVGLTAWWALNVPYQPERLLSAIPADAAFVTEHRHLAARWDFFSKNPFARSLFASLGVKPADLDQLAENPESRQWFNRLAAEHVVLAFVPSLGEYREPGWVFASWLGGGSQRMRWSLGLHLIPGFKEGRTYRGRPYWVVATPFLDPDQKLVVSFVEGMLVGCLAKHESAIAEVLDAYDGLAPSVARGRGFPSSGPWCRDPVAPDRGWVNASELWGRATLKPLVLAYEFSKLMEKSLEGQVCGASPLPLVQSVAPKLKYGELDRILGDLPLGVCIAESSMVLPALDAHTSPAWARLFGELIREQKPASIMFSLFGDDYSGRFKGLRVPTVIAGMPVKDADAATAWMKEALDRLNAHYQWGVIPREVPVGASRVFVVDGTAGNSYSMSLSLDEKPAYAVCGGWLLLASNLQSLQKLVGRYDDAKKSGAEVPRPGWQEGMEEEKAPCYCWVDLERGAKTLRMAVATYSLKLLIEDPQKTLHTRQELNEAKAWIDSLAPLDQCRIWLLSDGVTMEAKFKMGHGG